MAQHTIRFHDGQRMSWDVYRRMMMHQLSPFQAVARSPQGALDQAMRRRGRDQEGGKLSKVYCDATEKYLGDNGVDPDDVAAVMKVLTSYAEEQAEDEVEVGGPRGTVELGGPRPKVDGASDRHLALDAYDVYGQLRVLHPSPVSLGGPRDGFARRFPEASRIKVV